MLLTIFEYTISGGDEIVGIRKTKMQSTALDISWRYWLAEEKWLAWALLLGVITLNLGLVAISVLLNTWQSNFYQVIQEYNQRGFLEAVAKFALLATCYTLVRGYQIYLRMMLHIRWRRWLTKYYLNNWLYGRTYYRLQLLANDITDNPDQRLSEDIEMFVSLSLRLSLDLLQDLTTIFSFVVILWQLSGVEIISLGQYQLPIYGYLVWAAIIYAAIGTYYTLRVGRPLVNLDFDQQRYEADFRFGLMRLRENAESVALYNGENYENLNFGEKFQRIFGNYLNIAMLRKRLTWLSTGYDQVSSIFAVFVASPRYFKGEFHLGQMFQIIDAYHRVQSGFSFIIDSFARIAEWRAVVNRLDSFLISMDFVRTALPNTHQMKVVPVSQSVFKVQHLNIFLPNGNNLIKNINLSLSPRERLLVVGPSGYGKSTLLRALAGIWPYATGELYIPSDRKIMFVPQKTYMPLRSLREILLYPERSANIKNAALENILYSCKLPYLIPKLNVIDNWGQTLSLGEQQRIAFAQIHLQRPDWLFLDEATSALDEKTEREMYSLLTKQLPHTSIVSVGHRQALTEYHLTKLEIGSNGWWQLTPI
jgi:putative ATP-binding cassette transporter